ncbi:2-amino-4-hydroxy-6-hydroxymethyldihydropteridine diphosphokinase [Heliobacillus mobilis]|uniref:Bifunctional folate synthesis protein n=1 Tax=Heliobacterium mobile TaxID=28064 RepID=A0A6I3SI20_HELMO|nr:2-amino-4-hydroxy-6-hydroxymethyldihydropteridine diphosphokinase [Heliobacterium mobile]MTV48511.1 2-amino-4-hydroxy-6-hydroxymethyldihydropteridine diphosphokinase [Heliobacterium mobile]
MKEHECKELPLTADRILLEGMTFYGYHGALPEETVLGQPFQVDLELHVDLTRAGKWDKVEESVHYGEVYEEVKRILEGPPKASIEAVANSIIEAVYGRFSKVQGIRVRVQKPKAPVPGIFRSMTVEMFRPAPTPCFIGLGSNMGNKADHLTQALRMLAQVPGLAVVEHSSWYLSKPVGFTDQDDFMNGVARVLSWLTPQELLRVLLETEKELGRERTLRWGPRTIDLDLLLYGDQVVRRDDLIVPHERMYERAFVLLPLAEIAPDYVHLDGMTTRQHVSRLNDSSDVILHVPKSSVTI